LILVAD